MEMMWMKEMDWLGEGIYGTIVHGTITSEIAPVMVMQQHKKKSLWSVVHRTDQVAGQLVCTIYYVTSRITAESHRHY
jgi:hypothetical protein